MPFGVMEWFAGKTGEGRIRHLGRRYPVSADDVIDREAMAPRARVHFDVERDEGIARAVNVRLRAGTRVSRRQRRFGNLAGAGRPEDAAGRASTRQRQPRHVDLTAYPREVVDRWVTAVAADDTPTAMALYAPDVVIREEGETLLGRRGAQQSVDGCSLRGTGVKPALSGDGYTFLAAWPAPEGEARTRMRVNHGEIVEQWTEREPSMRPSSRKGA